MHYSLKNKMPHTDAEVLVEKHALLIKEQNASYRYRLNDFRNKKRANAKSAWWQQIDVMETHIRILAQPWTIHQ